MGLACPTKQKRKALLRRVFSISAVGVLLFASCRHPAATCPPEDPNPRFLAANGTALRTRRGAGEIVQLRGVNLGGWLEWQAWMCPIDSSGTLRDANPGHNGYDFEVRKLLTKRFGPAVAENLVNAYRDAWITAHDIDNIKSLGLNVIRLTLAYDTMLQDDGAWRGDAFVRPDWLVTNAWQRGLYTIIDLHAFLPPGANQDGGAGGYWSDGAQKAETVRIWKRIAEHYRGNPAVAMYDLLNEPNNSYFKDRASAGGVGSLQPVRPALQSHPQRRSGPCDRHGRRVGLAYFARSGQVRLPERGLLVSLVQLEWEEHGRT